MELGRSDICVKVSMVYFQLSLSCVGHLQEFLHIFAYFKAHTNSELVFGPSEHYFDKCEFPSQYWDYLIYRSDECEIREVLPSYMPKLYGKFITIQVYINSDHTGYCVTRHSRSGLVVFLNNAPIY